MASDYPGKAFRGQESLEQGRGKVEGAVDGAAAWRWRTAFFPGRLLAGQTVSHAGGQLGLRSPELPFRCVCAVPSSSMVTSRTHTSTLGSLHKLLSPGQPCDGGPELRSAAQGHPVGLLPDLSSHSPATPGMTVLPRHQGLEGSFPSTRVACAPYLCARPGP